MGMETVAVGARGLAPPTAREPPNLTPDDMSSATPFFGQSSWCRTCQGDKLDGGRDGWR